jgi:hypothetical protein
MNRLSGRRPRNARSRLAVDDEAVDRAQDAPGSSRDVRQPDEPVREPLAAGAPFELFLADWFPEFVDRAGRTCWDLVYGGSDGGDRTKVKAFKVKVEPGAVTVCVPNDGG